MIDIPMQFDKNGLKVEVNWNSEVTPCKQIKFTIDGKTVIISREDLYSLMFLFGDKEQQVNLIPVEETTVTMVRRLLKVRAKNDIKKGEIVAFPYEYPIAKSVYEKMSPEKKLLNFN